MARQTTKSSRDRQQVTYRNRSARTRKTAGGAARKTTRTTTHARKQRGVPEREIGIKKVGIVAVVLVVLAIALLGAHNAASKSAQWKHDHKWQSTVEAAEDYFGVDRGFTDCMLTILQVESSGNENIDDRHDIAQAWEGDGSKYMKKGLKKKGVKPYTVEASIYAGVCELSLCIKDFEKYLGYEPDPTNLNDLALLAQGYNYGHLGWFSWLQSQGITEWSLDVSEAYQERIGGLGTAIHGQKIMDTYKRVTSK